MSKLLALDQSSRITGYAIFENGQLIKYDKFELTNPNIDVRLFQLRDKIIELLYYNQIDEVVLEDIQQQNNVANNVQTFKTLAEVYGVICELLEENGIKHSSVLATQWKSTLGIKGKARAQQKQNAQKYVLNTYNIKATQDVCDAICIGAHYLKQTANDWTE